MNNPPCPVCGTPLRWFPDQQAWGCDRCRQMIAPAPHGMPQRRGKLPWILVGGGVVAVGAILLVLGLRGGDKVDCEKYVDRRVALATAGLSGADVELVGQRSRAVHSDACHGGNVSAEQAACVDGAASQDEALRCFIPERAASAGASAGSAGASAGSARSATTTPLQTTPQTATGGTVRERAEQAAAAATEVIDAFADAIGDDRCGKEAAVHAVALAMAEKVALVRAALSDPAVAAEAGKLSGDAFSTAFERWSRTRIEGTCRVEEDIEIIQGMLSPRAAP
jgi:hypothetical protein